MSCCHSDDGLAAAYSDLANAQLKERVRRLEAVLTAAGIETVVEPAQPAQGGRDFATSFLNRHYGR